jgi:acetyl esterase/lipase
VLAGRDQRVKATISWSAVPVERLNWKPEFTLMDGREVAENFAMLVGKQFYDGLPEFNPLAEAQKSRSPMLVIYGSDDESVPPADVAHFQQAIAATGNTCDVQVIEGADHIFFRYIWKQQAIRQIVAWLVAKL